MSSQGWELPAGLEHHQPALDLFLLFHPSGGKTGWRRSWDLRENGNLGSLVAPGELQGWDVGISPPLPFLVNNSLSWVGFAPGRGCWDVGRGLFDPFLCKVSIERSWGWGWELNKGLLFPSHAQHENKVQTNNRRLFLVLFRWNSSAWDGAGLEISESSKPTPKGAGENLEGSSMEVPLLP